jgi:hypothetical protein
MSPCGIFCVRRPGLAGFRRERNAVHSRAAELVQRPAVARRVERPGERGEQLRRAPVGQARLPGQPAAVGGPARRPRPAPAPGARSRTPARRSARPAASAAPGWSPPARRCLPPAGRRAWRGSGTWLAASIWSCVPPGQNIRALWHPGAHLVALWLPGSIHSGPVAPRARFVSAPEYSGRVPLLALWHSRRLPVPPPSVTDATKTN